MKLIAVHHFDTFIDSGLRMHILTGIDFSQQNGMLDNQLSHHKIADNYVNPYEDSMRTILTELLKFTVSDDIPAQCYGLTSKSSLVHCESLHFDNGCRGVEGLIKSYKEFLSADKFQQSFRCQFAPIIKRIARMVNKSSKIDQFILVLFA